MHIASHNSFILLFGFGRCDEKCVCQNGETWNRESDKKKERTFSQVCNPLLVRLDVCLSPEDTVR